MCLSLFLFIPLWAYAFLYGTLHLLWSPMSFGDKFQVDKSTLCRRKLLVYKAFQHVGVQHLSTSYPMPAWLINLTWKSQRFSDKRGRSPDTHHAIRWVDHQSWTGDNDNQGITPEALNWLHVIHSTRWKNKHGHSELNSLDGSIWY